MGKLIDLEDLNEFKTQMLNYTINTIYPVGSIYTSVNNELPSCFDANQWAVLNSGNAVKVVVGDMEIITGSTEHAVSGNEMAWKKVDGTNIPITGTSYIGVYGGGSSAYITGVDQATFTGHSWWHAVPSNLYASTSSSLSVYMWKRIA